MSGQLVFVWIVFVWMFIMAAFIGGYHYANYMFHKKLSNAYQAMSAKVQTSQQMLTADDVIEAFEGALHP